MTYKAKMNDYTECWTDLTYSGKGLLAPFYIFVGIASFLFGFTTLGFLMVSDMNSILGYVIVLISGVIFICSGVIHLSMANNFGTRVRVVEALGADRFKLTFWRARDNNQGLHLLRNEIAQVHRCSDPKNIRDYLSSLPREPSCYCFSLVNGRAFQVAGDDDSVQKLLKLLSVTKEMKNSGTKLVE